MQTINLSELLKGRNRTSKYSGHFRIDENSPSGLSDMYGKPVGYMYGQGKHKRLKYWKVSFSKKQQELFGQGSTNAHRIIMSLAYGDLALDGLVINHLNADGLDNRLINLEICTVAENNKHRDVSQILRMLGLL